VAFSDVINACFVHSRGCLWGNSSAIIPELTTSRCSISRTLRKNAFVDHGGFPLQAAINLLRSSLRTPAVRYTVNWPPFASIWIYSHPTACCFLFFLLPVLRMIFKCASSSAKCNSVRKPHAILPDTPGNLTSASKYFQTLPDPPGAKQSALRLCKSILGCSWKHLQLWRCTQDAPARIVKFWSSWDLCADLRETSREAETAVQLGGLLWERPRPL